MTDHMEAWKVSERDFPKNGTPQEILSFCVKYAVLAPSVYNTQPWHFNVDDKNLYLYADRRQALAVIDPDDRQLNMCCTAALYGVRLALRYFGFEETTELMPDPSDANLLAKVKLGAKSEKEIDSVTEALFQSIVKRHTNRGVFADKQAPEDVINNLKQAASSEGSWLHICDDPERKIITRMVIEADHIQASNKHFRRELASWEDSRRNLSGDGLPNYGLDYTSIMNSLSPSIVRRFNVENNQTASDLQLEEYSPILAVLGSRAGGTIERLNTGQALMRVLLQAEVDGLSVSTLNQPCEVPELRLVLHDEISRQGRAQMILRIGYGGKPSYTPRRPLEDVLTLGVQSAALSAPKIANDSQKSLFGRVKGLFGK